MNPVFLDGEITTTEEAKVSVLDRGYLFGDGVYEVYRVYGKTPFTRDLHLARLERSLDGIEITLPYTPEQFAAILDRMEALSPSDSYVYIHVTRGVAPRRHSLPDDPKPTVMVMPVPLPPIASGIFVQGVSLTSQLDDRWLHCNVKSLNLLANCMALTKANRLGSFETLLIGSDGLVNESATSSFFAVIDGQLRTAPLTRNILPGVTRHVVLELARANGIPVDETPFTLAQAQQADEAFITNSVFEILPVARIDDSAIGSLPSKLTRELIELFAAKVERETGARAVSLAALEA